MRKRWLWLAGTTSGLLVVAVVLHLSGNFDFRGLLGMFCGLVYAAFTMPDRGQ